MNQEQSNFIEETALLFEQTGLTRMAGRIFGYLLVMDEEAVSFDRLCEELQASKGSISSNIKVLAQLEFVIPVSLPGDRKTYYRSGRKDVGDIMRDRLSLHRKFARMFGEAAKIRNRSDAVTDWINESAAFYEWVEEQVLCILDQWQQEKEHLLKKSTKRPVNNTSG
jgi:DNA-binding transcriptional regulator GbsR (MarR family)